MTLTIGYGPFGDQPTGEFNFERTGPERVIFWDDHPRQVRVEFNGHPVAESTRAKLLHETTLLPVFYFPLDDVDADVLEPSEHRSHCPYKGDAAYWNIRVGDQVAENAVWGYDEPLDHAPPLAGYRAFYWNAVDAWYEEDEEIFVHAPDPYHRLDVRRSRRHVQVLLDGEVVAESDTPVILFETGLPPRFYLDPADVRADVLAPSASHTRCPYKGVASYHHLEVSGRRHDDLVWHYPDALPEVAKIEGRLCFFNEKVDLIVDGEPWERPITKFS